jgi:uncharacterized membrane protein
MQRRDFGTVVISPPAMLVTEDRLADLVPLLERTPSGRGLR